MAPRGLHAIGIARGARRSRSILVPATSRVRANVRAPTPRVEEREGASHALVDLDLDLDPGSANPYRGPVPPGMGRRFTAQLVFTAPPARREPNTCYVGVKRNGEPNPAVFNILRTTDSVLGALPPNSTGVTIVVSSEEDRPRNARPEDGVTWLDWGRYLDGQLTFRFLLRRDPMLVALKEAVDGRMGSAEIAAYVPRAGHCSRGEFEARGAGVLA